MKGLGAYLSASVLAVGVHLLIGLSAAGPGDQRQPEVRPRETAVLIRFIRPAAPDRPVSPRPASVSPEPALAAASPAHPEPSPVVPSPVQTGAAAGVAAPAPTAKPGPPPRPVSVSILPPVPTSPIVPDYPRVARLRGYEGLVQIRAVIDAEGHVGRAEIVVSSGHAILDNAARGAVERTSFTPARKGDTATGYTLLVPVRFSLSDR